MIPEDKICKVKKCNKRVQAKEYRLMKSSRKLLLFNSEGLVRSIDMDMDLVDLSVMATTSKVIPPTPLKSQEHWLTLKQKEQQNLQYLQIRIQI